MQIHKKTKVKLTKIVYLSGRFTLAQCPLQLMKDGLLHGEQMYVIAERRREKLSLHLSQKRVKSCVVLVAVIISIVILQLVIRNTNIITSVYFNDI